MNDKIICGQCPAVYEPEEIDAYVGESKASTLALLNDRSSAAGETTQGRRLLRRALGLPGTPTASGPNVEVLARFKAYTFRCPRGHVVDGNPGAQFPLAVLGASGSSKSHILPALVCELDDLMALSGIGVTLSDTLHTNPRLNQNVIRLYRQGRDLPPTPPGQVSGPFGYKLLVGKGRADPDAARYSLLLFDVAGEDLASTVRIAEKAPFMVLSQALLVLIDPVGFLPTQFDDGRIVNRRDRVNAARDVRQGIRVIAETLAEVWGLRSSLELKVPICFVISKADSIEWGGVLDWGRATSSVLGAPDLAGALSQSSTDTRDAFVVLGGELVADEIEERFDPAYVRWTAASATGAMPLEVEDADGNQWTDFPEPNGVALSMLQLLDLAGMLPAPSPGD